VPEQVRLPRPELTRHNVLDGRAVAELLHLPISTVLEYARRGVIPAHKLGRRKRATSSPTAFHRLTDAWSSRSMSISVTT
jgi:Helix-turn-helix domain